MHRHRQVQPTKKCLSRNDNIYVAEAGCAVGEFDANVNDRSEKDGADNLLEQEWRNIHI